MNSQLIDAIYATIERKIRFYVLILRPDGEWAGRKCDIRDISLQKNYS